MICANIWANWERGGTYGEEKAPVETEVMFKPKIFIFGLSKLVFIAIYQRNLEANKQNKD